MKSAILVTQSRGKMANPGHWLQLVYYKSFTNSSVAVTLSSFQLYKRRNCPVWSKFSCGFPVVKFEQASQPFAGPDLAGRFTDSVLWPWKKNHIPFPLVISFVVKMKNVI